MVTVHVPVPEQAPDQPLNIYPDVGAAVSATDVPLLYVEEHVEPQEIPAGLLVTVPFGEVTERVKVGMVVKVAVTLVFAFTVITHEPVPEQPPDQPVNVEPLAAATDKVVEVPAVTVEVHVVPQLIDPPVMVPVPVPVLATDTV